MAYPNLLFVRLSDTLYEHLEASDRPVPGILTDGSFPDEIYGKHCISCWQHTHNFLRNQANNLH